MRMILIAAIGSILVGCPPTTVDVEPQRLPELPSCAVLMETTPEGEQKWWAAVEQEGAIRLCFVFHRGASGEQCVLEPTSAPVDAPESSGVTNWAVANQTCLAPSIQYMQCEHRNCEDIYDILDSQLRCTTAISARRSGECHEIWIRKQ